MKNLLFLSFLIMFFAHTNSNVQIKNSLIKSLRDNTMTNLSSLISKEGNLFVFFQSSCPYCRKQIKNLDCLKDKTKIVLIGLGNNEDSLRKELNRLNVNYSAYYSTPKQIAQLSIKVPATPYSIYIKKGTQKAFLGLKSCQNLAKNL